MSFLRRKKPFLLPATILSFVLLIMAIVTKRYISYTNIGVFGSYTPVDGDNEAFCDQHVFRALKVTQFTSSNPDPLDLKTYAMCPWEQNTGRIFLAAASLMCLWSLIELFLAYKSKFYMFFNIIDVFVLALGSVAAGYMLNDIQQDTGNCSDVDALNTAGATSTPYYRCNRSLYDVAFILLILNLALWLFQLIYNIVRRKVQNEHKQEEIGYSSVPAHQSVPTDPHGAPVNTAGEAGTSANRLP